VRELGGAWYGRHMAAAERAIVDRLTIVDVVLEIRDARVGISALLLCFCSCSFYIKFASSPYYIAFRFQLPLQLGLLIAGLDPASM
jgi:hypothetical protein